MRVILVILDGIGDRGQHCFSGATPLQVAYTPNLDYLASIGMNGLYHSLMQGIPMSSENAHFLIFGYDLEEFPGRGYIEAIGKGVDLKDNVSILCHICCVEKVDDRLILRWGRPDMSDSESKTLMDEVRMFEAEGITISLIHSGGIDGFLILAGDVSEEITDSDPIYEGKFIMKVEPIKKKKIKQSAKKTAVALNKYLLWCHERLSQHPINKERTSKNLLPVNALVTQRAGKKKDLAPFIEKWGMKALSISSGAIYWGLCKGLGIDTIKVKDTGNVEEDLRNRLLLARDAKDYDFIHVHTKMPDEAGHTKNPWHKKEIIEAIDRSMDVCVNEIAKDEDVLLVITSDHSTASSGIMIHTGETVPLTMVGKYVRKDVVSQFNEIACAQGSLGIVRGKELMYLILNFLDRAKMYGLMDTPYDQPFYPGNYEPLSFKNG